MNEQELAQVIDELATLRGARLRNAWQPSRDRIVLGIGDRYLLVVPRGPFARVHFVSQRVPNPSRPYSFQGALRAHLVRPLDEVTKTPGERAADLVFGPSIVHVRLTGRTGGIWLSVDGRVLASLDGPAAAIPELLAGAGSASRPPRFAPAPGQSWNEAAEDWFTPQEANQGLEDRRKRVGAALRARLTRDQRLLAALERDLRRAEGVDEARARADAFAANIYAVPAGSAAFEAKDLNDPGIVHRYQLDPKKSPGKYLNDLYGRVRRLERTADRTLAQMDDVAARTARLARALEEVPSAAEERLEALQSLAPNAVRTSDVASLPYWTWLGPRGEVVLVGKNAVGNRRLTFQMARASDVWLHVRDLPGPHVLIRGTRGHAPPLETLLAAAQIALIGTKVGEGASADVQYTAANKVKAIKGSDGAAVIVHDERVLRVSRGEDHLRGWTLEGAADHTFFDTFTRGQGRRRGPA